LRIFNAEVESRLRAAGWYPGRRVPDAQIEYWIREARRQFGCYVFREAVRVLTEYGGLVLGNGSIHLDPLFGQWMAEPELWHYWEWEQGEVLFPIGGTGDKDTVFAVSTTGQVVGAGIVATVCGATLEETLSIWLTPGQYCEEDRKALAECRSEGSVGEYQRYCRLAFREVWDE
jgi:hypothetical protein